MTLTDKQKKYLLYGAPILIGLYLIYRQFAKSKPKTREQVLMLQPESPNTPSKPSGNDSLPLHNGSRDAGAPTNPNGRVVQLQRLINVMGYKPSGSSSYVQLVEDGIYGNKTEAAVVFWISKPTIDNTDDWNNLSSKVYLEATPPLLRPNPNMNDPFYQGDPYKTPNFSLKNF
jgi:hypothetical protein